MEKFYGQFDPPVDKFIFERYFPDKNTKGIFVECGAFDGLTECACKFFEEFMGWQGYNIEPVPWIYEKLCTNRPSAVNLNFALSDTNGEATFNAVDHPTFGKDCTNGSLRHTEAHSALLKEMECKIVEVSVKLCTWPEFISQSQITQVDLLVLDVEGHELSVIAGMRGCHTLPDLICIEVGHIDFGLIRSELYRLGYLYDISSHVNAFFIKNEKLPLFALRRNDALIRIFSAFQEHQQRVIETIPSPDLLVNEVDNAVLVELENENHKLREHASALEGLHAEILKSKGWYFIELVRKFRKIIGL